MIRRTLAAVAVLLAAGVAPAQDTPSVFSRPALPPREALDRLNLKVAWRTYATTDGPRDAVKSVLLAGDDIFVHARSGIVTCIDPLTGQTRWRTTTGPAYPIVAGVTYNSRYVFAVNGNMMTTFDRISGRQLWTWEMPSSISAQPFADDEQLYFGLANNKIAVYLLPDVGPKAPKGAAPKAADPNDPKAPKDAKPPEVKPVPALGGKPVVVPESDRGVMANAASLYGGSGAPLAAVGPLSTASAASRTTRVGGVEPIFLYDYLCESPVATPPVMGLDGLLYAGANGTIFTVSRRVGKELFPGGIVTGGPILTPPRGYGDVAYVPGGDNVLYAVKISSPTGRRYWRFSKGAPILYRPAVTDDSVFVAVERGGLWRLDRETGIEVWGNLDAGRFLAANAKFVYALDRSGRLMVLDRKRGTRLSGYDTRDFNVPVINDDTDRIYLSAHDGLLACIHDKDYAAPLAMRSADAVAMLPDKKPKAPGGAGVDVGPAPPGGDKPKEPGAVEVGPGDKPKEMPKEGVEVGPGGKPKDKPKEGVEVGPGDKPKEKPKDKPKDGVGVGKP